MQNALSFLENMPDTFDVAIVARAGSPIVDLCIQKNVPCYTVPQGLFSRLFWEALLSFGLPRRCGVFTFFGPPFIFGWIRLFNVSGFAYSNLLYPEIDFWHWYKGPRRLRVFLTDIYRRFVISKANALVFETCTLKHRADSCGWLNHSRHYVVRMAASSLVAKENVSDKIRLHYLNMFSRHSIDINWHSYVLFLASDNPNKRLHLLPYLLAESKRKDYKFVLTLDPRCKYLKTIQTLAFKLNVSDRIVNVGVVDYRDVSSLISCVDAMANLAQLESFSNNFIEAWKMRVPLVVTDSDWARDACGEAAAYVDPEKSRLAISSVEAVLFDPNVREDLVSAGDQMLASYPTANEKSVAYLDLLNNMVKE